MYFGTVSTNGIGHICAQLQPPRFSFHCPLLDSVIMPPPRTHLSDSDGIWLCSIQVFYHLSQLDTPDNSFLPLLIPPVRAPASARNLTCIPSGTLLWTLLTSLSFPGTEKFTIWLHRGVNRGQRRHQKTFSWSLLTFSWAILIQFFKCHLQFLEMTSQPCRKRCLLMPWHDMCHPHDAHDVVVIDSLNVSFNPLPPLPPLPQDHAREQGVWGLEPSLFWPRRESTKKEATLFLWKRTCSLDHAH